MLSISMGTTWVPETAIGPAFALFGGLRSGVWSSSSSGFAGGRGKRELRKKEAGKRLLSTRGMGSSEGETTGSEACGRR